MPGLSRAELERTAREHLAEPPRITLARMVREASVASKTKPSSSAGCGGAGRSCDPVSRPVAERRWSGTRWR